MRQGRIFLEASTRYEGSLWIKRENGASKLTLRILGSNGNVVTTLQFASAGTDWHELPFSFTSHLRDTQASIEITASGHGELLVDREHVDPAGQNDDLFRCGCRRMGRRWERMRRAGAGGHGRGDGGEGPAKVSGPRPGAAIPVPVRHAQVRGLELPLEIEDVDATRPA